MDGTIKFNIFDIDEEAASKIVGSEEESSEEEETIVENTEEIEDLEDSQEEEEKEEEEEESSEESEQEEEEESSKPAETGKILLDMIDQGYLLLPEDYEYEDSEEGLKKAFEDSETERNKLAFEAAVKFLVSEKAEHLLKIRENNNRSIKYSDIELSELEEEQKVNLIKNEYRERGFSEEDIEEKILDIEELGKVDKEAKRALKYLAEKESTLEQKEIERLAAENKEREKQQKESMNLLKETLKKDDLGGYRLSPETKKSAIDMIYKPIEIEEGNEKRVDTEFNHLLAKALNHPVKILVLADVLKNQTEEGFNFPNLETKIKTKEVQEAKKTLRKLRESGSKSKISGGKQAQTKKDFDLSEAKFLNL